MEDSNLSVSDVPVFQPVNPADITAFEKKIVTTMVAIVKLDGEIIPAQSFTMLPITRVQLSEIKGNSKNVSLPHLPILGSILSMRYENEVRGIILNSQKKTHFRNSITIDMSIKDKNVNFRLSKSTIHICGVRSFEQIKETAAILFNHLKQIQIELDYIQANMSKAMECIKFVQNNIRSVDNYLIVPENLEIDQRIFTFAKRNLLDHTTAIGFLTELKWIFQQSKVYTGELGINKIETSMINKNYDVGFKINRRALAKYIRRVGEFYLDYDNAITHSVKIMLPFKIPEGANVRRKQKKNSIPHHTFMVYKSGCVTQSGPSLELMEDAYYKFFNAVLGLRHLIEKPSKVGGTKKKVIIRKIIEKGTEKEIKSETEKEIKSETESKTEELRIEDITEISDSNI